MIHQVFRLWFVIGALCSLALVKTAQAQRALPDDNLAYPVLVQFPNSEASGFYITTSTSIYLITAKHVLFDQNGKLQGPQMTLLSYPSGPKESGRNFLSVDLTLLTRNGDVIPHPHEDVVVVRIARIAAAEPSKDPTKKAPHLLTLVPGVTAAEIVKGGLVGVGLDTVKKYDEVLVGNDVLVFGYPTSIGLKQLPQLDPLRPLLRRGIVAGLNPATKVLVIDCPVYPGNSGGPIVEIDPHGFTTEFMVIGVVLQFVPFAESLTVSQLGYQNITVTNSGYAIAAPMDLVLELVK